MTRCGWSPTSSSSSPSLRPSGERFRFSNFCASVLPSVPPSVVRLSPQRWFPVHLGTRRAREGEGAGWARAPSIYLPPERNVFKTAAAAGVNFCSVPLFSAGVAGPRARSHSFKVLPEGAAAAGATADDHKFECESASFGSDLSVGGIVICCWGGLPPSLLLLLLPLLPSGPSSSSPYT